MWSTTTWAYVSLNVTDTSRFSFTNVYGSSLPFTFIIAYEEVAMVIVFSAWLLSRDEEVANGMRTIGQVTSSGSKNSDRVHT